MDMQTHQDDEITRLRARLEVLTGSDPLSALGMSARVDVSGPIRA